MTIHSCIGRNLVKNTCCLLENHKKKHLAASFASLRLSLEAFRLHSCIGRNLVKNTCLELNLTSYKNTCLELNLTS
ncbi:unnamed protein product [Brassica oleracea var. botrytis]